MAAGEKGEFTFAWGSLGFSHLRVEVHIHYVSGVLVWQQGTVHRPELTVRGRISALVSHTCIQMAFSVQPRQELSWQPVSKWD